MYELLTETVEDVGFDVEVFVWSDYVWTGDGLCRWKVTHLSLVVRHLPLIRLRYDIPSLISARKGGSKHVLLNPKNPNLIPGVRNRYASSGGGAQRRGHEVHAQLWHARTAATVFFTMGADWGRALFCEYLVTSKYHY